MVGLEEDEYSIYEESKVLSFDMPSIDNILPKEGVYLSLDISKSSTGITFVNNGEFITGNINLEDEKGDHKEVLLRRALKRDLSELVQGVDFDLIIIEDVFVGSNPETARLLFALNTAIDELILDEVCSTKKFLRVSNQRWKSWLYTLDTNNISRGYDDKEKVRICLELIGFTDSGEGYQDRLDSMGMLVSYFLKGKEQDDKGILKRNKIRFSDIEASYDIDSSYLFYGLDYVDRDKVEFIDFNKITKKRMLELLTSNPEAVYVTGKPVLLGNLAIELGLDYIVDGGYFAFWIKPNKLKRYIKEVD